jgi:D-3-phosphoglycerate dehydrogenase
MKSSAYLINTSRGAIIDRRALENALQQGAIAGAALDVFDPEPPDLSEPLYRDERVIVTPHAAFLSEESLVELRSRAATQIAQALQGKRPEHVANDQVYGHPS